MSMEKKKTVIQNWGKIIDFSSAEVWRMGQGKTIFSFNPRDGNRLPGRKIKRLERIESHVS